MLNLTENVLPIIRKTRDITLPHWGNVNSFKNKGVNEADVVTEIDGQVEEFLKQELKAIYPDIGFVGEESDGDRNVATFWLVDPIDGTAHFIRGMPFCTTMLALIDKGEVVFAVIYDFINNIVYHAEKGKGAYKNDTPIRVSGRVEGDFYFGHEIGLKKEENLAFYLRFREMGMPFNCIAAGFEFAIIADGKLDGRICIDPFGKDYDFAPGSLLVSEAGGEVHNIGKEDYDYTNLNFLAGNKNFCAKIRRLLEGQGIK